MVYLLSFVRPPSSEDAFKADKFAKVKLAESMRFLSDVMLGEGTIQVCQGIKLVFHLNPGVLWFFPASDLELSQSDSEVSDGLHLRKHGCRGGLRDRDTARHTPIKAINVYQRFFSWPNDARVCLHVHD